jgi:hypothetical protein
MAEWEGQGDRYPMFTNHILHRGEAREDEQAVYDAIGSRGGSRTAPTGFPNFYTYSVYIWCEIAIYLFVITK